MTNLTNLSNLAKKLIVPIFILAIIALLVFLIIFRQKMIREKSLTPKSKISAPTLIQSPLIERSGSIKIDENLAKSKEKSTPTAVYQLSEQTLDTQRASQIAASFGLTEEPKVIQDATLGQIFRWSSDQQTLSIDRFKLIYKKNLSPQTKPTPIPRRIFTTEDLNEAINQFVQQHGLANDSFSLTPEKVSFYKIKPDGKAEKVGEISQADKISALLAVRAGGYPLIDHNADQTPSSLSISSSGEISSLSYRLLPSIQPLEKYPTKSIAEAAKEVAAGKGIVTGFISEEEPKEGEVQMIKTALISLSKTNLAYYLPIPSPDILQPVYVFTGSTKTVGGENGQISIIILAIQDEFFTQP